MLHRPSHCRHPPHDAHTQDIWAFGCLVFEMLHGTLCFNATSIKALQQAVRTVKHSKLDATLTAGAAT